MMSIENRDEMFQNKVEELKSNNITLITLGDVSELINYESIDLASIIICCDEDNVIKSLRDMGYYNIINCENRYSLSDDEFEGLNKLSELMIKLNPEVLYNYNKTDYIQKTLINNGQLKTASVILSDLLIAINTNDNDKFKRVVKYSLDSLMASVQDLQKALNTVDNDILWEYKYNAVLIELHKLKDALDQSEITINKLNSTINTLQSYKDEIVNYEKLKIELEEANKDNIKLMNENNSLKVSLNNSTDTEEVASLREKINELEEKLSEEKKKVFQLESTNNDNYKDEIIANLKEALQSKSNDQTSLSDSEFPIINDRVPLRAKKIVYIKEVKPTIYLNNLIESLDILGEKCKTNGMNMKIITIVYDRLENAYQMKKYTKHQYSINTAPINSVVITNNLTTGFINNVVNLKDYDCIFIIDRLGFMKDICARNDCNSYYLIDSPKDITDFKLKPDKCVAFFGMTKEDESSTVASKLNPVNVAYRIIPNRILAEYVNQNMSMFNLVKTEFVEEVIKSGIK